jgi:uncharacterized Fe-S cluster-containing MiaB family protein
MNLIQATELVNSSASSIFSKEDVIKILNQVEVEAAPEKKSDQEYAKLFIGFLSDFLQNENLDEVVEIDYESAEFALGCNNVITLDNVNAEIDYSEFLKKFKNAMYYAIDNG